MHTDGTGAAAPAPLARVGLSMFTVNGHAGLGPSVCIGVHRCASAALALRHVAWIRPVNVRRDEAGACSGWCLYMCMGSCRGFVPRVRPDLGRGASRPTVSIPPRSCRPATEPGQAFCRVQAGDHACRRCQRLMNVSLYDGRDSAAWHANWLDYTRVGVRFEDDLRLVPARYAGNHPKDPCGQGSARGCVRPGSVFTVLSLYVSVLKILAMPHPAPATGTIRSLCAETPCAIAAEFPPKRVVGDGRPLR